MRERGYNAVVCQDLKHGTIKHEILFEILQHMHTHSNFLAAKRDTPIYAVLSLKTLQYPNVSENILLTIS